MNGTKKITDIWPAYRGVKVDADIHPVKKKMDVNIRFSALYAEQGCQLQESLRTVEKNWCGIRFSALYSEQECQLKKNLHIEQKNGSNIHNFSIVCRTIDVTLRKNCIERKRWMLHSFFFCTVGRTEMSSRRKSGYSGEKMDMISLFLYCK